MSIERKTEFSQHRIFRYTLWRDWSADIATNGLFTEDPHGDYYPGRPDQYVQFIGLNPSTADETKDDPTIRKCIGFAKRWGFGALCMTNLFAFRATDPRVMMGCPKPVGDDNDMWIVRCAREAGMIVAAWGTKGEFMGRDVEVLKLLPTELHRLRRTKHGHPEHPLYVPYEKQPEKFPYAN